MTNTKIIEQILADADRLVRKRLATAGLDVHHLMLAMAPDGAAVIRSNVGPAALRQVAGMLIEIADQETPIAGGAGMRH